MRRRDRQPIGFHDAQSATQLSKDGKIAVPCHAAIDRAAAMKAPKKSVADAKTRIVIVDDHPITREGLANLIRQTGDLTICGESADAEHAVAMIVDKKPDLVIVDISLPGRGGIELLKDIHALKPGLPVLIISMHDESLYAERALRAGARGYMMKQECGDRLIEGIREVLGGKICLSKNASVNLLEIFSAKHISDSKSPLTKLSDREFEVFRLLGEGVSTPDIGDRLSVSSKTVETHRMNIKAKLGFKTANELISFAARWISTEPDAKSPND